MAFDQNQQDQFNMNNGIDQVKQFQAELDKATASIGAAELAAEEELQHKKLDNLITLQKEKIKKLNELMNLEEDRLQELARVRLSLSDRQFEVRKKEIQEELRLARKAAEELLQIDEQRKRTNKSSSNVNKPVPKEKPDTTRSDSVEPLKSKAKTKTPQTSKAPSKSLQAITDALASLRSKLILQSEKEPIVGTDTPATPANAPTEAPSTEQLLKALNELKEVDLRDVSLGYLNDLVNTFHGYVESQANNFIDKVKPVPSASAEKDTVATTELIEALYSLNKTLASLQDVISGQKPSEEKDTPTERIAEDIRRANETQSPEQPVITDTIPKKGQEAKPNNNNLVPDKSDSDNITKSFDDNNGRLNADDKVDLTKSKKTLNDIIESLGSNLKYFESLATPNNNNSTGKETINPTLDLLNGIIAAGLKDKEGIAKAKEKGIELPQELAQSTIDFAGAWLDSIEKAENAEKALQDFRKDAETLALNRRLLALTQEQEERSRYLEEYQELQADSFNHLVENMSAAEYAALKAETAATEKAIKARSKANEAFDKAFTAQKSKGTLTEKKQLIEAVVKERAAEKDWSGTKLEIKDTDSDEEIARKKKAQEAAVKAEMAVNAAMTKLANLAQQLNAQTDKIGAKQSVIDTRLQGSSANDKLLGSYWKQLARDMNKIGAVNPYFTQEDFANNIETLINRGISFDLKQRAFLMTIQEKIANTFDAADGTLLRLIRIQQQDTTAGRLGMESALNSFLNSMYETSEYLSDVASSVRSSLEELQALMEGGAGTELEFQVQKWMGSLYSVGMSDSAVQDIARAFGQIASGDISGLNGSGTGNLLIMAANEAGMSIADILQEGLQADETNKLMQAMVNYLAEIAETSSDSRVVQQQLANVYGLRASDLRAATNLASSIQDVSKQDLTYSGMLGQLNKMANSMILRTSTGEMLSNVWDNVQYTMATQMANDPMLYLLPRVATLLEDYAGGIDLPFVNVMGFGVDLNTSVAQLMNVAAMSGSILGSLGPMISGLAGAVSGDVLLSLAGINTKESKIPVIARGAASTLQNLGGSSITESGYIGNSSSSDIKNATLQDAEDSKKKQLVEAKDEESSDDVVIKSQQAVIDIYNLLEEMAHGSQSLRVRVVNNNGGVISGSTASNNSIIGDYSSSSLTGGGVNTSADNGNWVLSF